MEDTDDPCAPWRGFVFKFKREEFELEAMRERIVLFDEFIDSKENPSELKKLNKEKEK